MAKSSRRDGQPREIDFEVDMTSQESIIKGAKHLFNIGLPEWNVDKIEMKPMSGGLTNILLRCKYTVKNIKFVLRIYGKKTETFIDREAEVSNILILNRYDLAPEIYFTFKNGLCFGFYEGKDLQESMLYDREFIGRLARLVARMHVIPLESDSKACTAPMIKNFNELAPINQIRKAEEGLEKIFKRPIDLRAELKVVPEIVKSLKSDVVFCHNDILPGNVIIDGEQVHLIDYEYAGPNYQAFDIGNHFCEFVGQVPADQSRFPKKEYQLEWIKMYLTEYRKLKSLPSPTDEDVYKLYVEVNKCALLACILWGLWALLQEENSSIDFSYMDFALGRFVLFFERKDEFLAL